MERQKAAPAPIFAVKRPRQALLAHPNNYAYDGAQPQPAGQRNTWPASSTPHVPSLGPVRSHVPGSCSYRPAQRQQAPLSCNPPASGTAWSQQPPVRPLGQQFTRPSSTARSTVAAGQTARFGRTFNCTAPASNGPLNTNQFPGARMQNIQSLAGRSPSAVFPSSSSSASAAAGQGRRMVFGSTLQPPNPSVPRGMLPSSTGQQRPTTSSVGPVNTEARQNEPVFQLKVKSSDQSLRLLTTTIKAMKQWAVYKDKLPLLFEVFGMMNSAVTGSQSRTDVNFLLKDSTDAVNCVFYQIDRQLPRLTRGLWYRCVGRLMSSEDGQCWLHCVSIRAMSDTEKHGLKSIIAASDAAFQQFISTDAEM